jgi:hypothetical protein
MGGIEISSEYLSLLRRKGKGRKRKGIYIRRF